MKLELTPEEQKSLELFAYYSRGYGFDEVERTYYFQYDQLEWDEADWTGMKPRGGSLETYDAIDKVINSIIERHELENITGDSDVYTTITFNIDCVDRTISLDAWEKVEGTEENSRELDSTENETLRKFCEEMKSEGFKLGTIQFEGSGDSGMVEDTIQLMGTTNENRSTTNEIDSLCYEMLEDFPGWEINDGSQGQFEFDFEDGRVMLDIGQNYYEDETVEIDLFSKF